LERFLLIAKVGDFAPLAEEKNRSLGAIAPRDDKRETVVVKKKAALIA